MLSLSLRAELVGVLRQRRTVERAELCAMAARCRHDCDGHSDADHVLSPARDPQRTAAACADIRAAQPAVAPERQDAAAGSHRGARPPAARVPGLPARRTTKQQTESEASSRPRTSRAARQPDLLANTSSSRQCALRGRAHAHRHVDLREDGRRAHALMTARLAWVVLVAIAAGSSTSGAASPESDAQEVARLDSQFQAAVKRNDVETRAQILHPDMVPILGDGGVNTDAAAVHDVAVSCGSAAIRWNPTESAAKTKRSSTSALAF